MRERSPEEVESFRIGYHAGLVAAAGQLCRQLGEDPSGRFESAYRGVVSEMERASWYLPEGFESRHALMAAHSSALEYLEDS